MRHNPIIALLVDAFALTPALAAEKQYGPGVSGTEIKIGQTVPYIGPASFYAPFGLAQQAYYKLLNEQGGVNGGQPPQPTSKESSPTQARCQ